MNSGKNEVVFNLIVTWNRLNAFFNISKIVAMFRMTILEALDCSNESRNVTNCHFEYF